MSEDIYSAPESELEASEAADDRFYVVAPVKFWVLYVVTFGLYQIYWFYQNWHNFKVATGRKMLPPLRGLFAIFFTHALFGEVNEALEDREIDVRWSPGGLASLYVILAVSSSVCDRLSDKNIGSPLTDVLSLLLLPVVGYVLYRAQRVINLAMGDPEGLSNSRFTGWNILWILLGSALWLAAVAGVVMMVFFPELVAD